MNNIYNLLISNIYLYIFVIIGLVILTAILLIVIQNQNKRQKIKDDFVQAEKVETELNKTEESSATKELEDLINKMKADMQVKPEDVVRKFEEEQEQKAIISYQELVDSVKSGKIEVIDDEESDTNYVENLNMEIETEPIIEETTSDSVISSNDAVTPSMLKEAINSISTNSVKEEPKRFKQSEFISPVYGIMDTGNLEYPTVKKTSNMMDLINTRDYNELTEEIRRQEEFLDALKAFRNNL